MKKSKTLNNGTAPIYLRLTVAGERVEFTTRRYIKPERWNSDSQKMNGTNDEARVFNNYLKTLEQKVFEGHRLMIDGKVPLTAANLRDRLLGTPDVKLAKMLVPIFKEHNRRIKSIVGKEYASGTLELYETSLKHTVAFVEWQYQKSDIDITEIDHEFITSYDYYLRLECKCSNNTAVKYIKNFKKIIRICIANGWLDKDPFINYKAKVKEVIRQYLTSDEIHQELANGSNIKFPFGTEPSPFYPFEIKWGTLGIFDLIPPAVTKEHYQLTHYPFFIEFYLRSSASGKAFMTQLLPRMMEHLEGKGIEKFAAVVNRRNIPAAKVLKRSGFKLAGSFDQIQDLYYY